MRYFGAMNKKWGESGALFIAAFISSFFLLFILIEPLIRPFYHSQKGLDVPVIQVNFANNKTDSADISNLEAPRKKPLELKGQINKDENFQKSEHSQAIASPPEELKPPIPPAGILDGFSFAPTQRASENPSSAPILGGRSGFRAKAPSAPGPKKSTDNASDQALETHRNQIGREVERRQAQLELAQVMTSLEANEEYRCSSKNNLKGSEIKKMQPTSNPENVQCLPSTPKAAFLAWVIGRLYPDEACIRVQVSQFNGLKKDECGR